MLFELSSMLIEHISFFNVFRYITFRAGGAVITSLVVSFLAGGAIIRWLQVKQKYGQPIREDGPPGHLLTKRETPTMGGVLILLSVFVATFLWADMSNPYIIIVVVTVLGFGCIGLWDDYLKVIRQHHRGLSGTVRLSAQALLSCGAVLALMYVNTPPIAYSVPVPILKDFLIILGPFFVLFGMVVITGSANAVNLTDGLDGLAIVPVMIAIASFAFIAYVAGHTVFSDYLQIHHVKDVGELVVFCGAVLGGGLGFLWYNAPPARVFMGDTGSLALGSALGVIAIAAKHELVLVIIGGLFVMEALSVIVQVISYKTLGRRLFRMAPLHHHFEQKGWPEATIVIRFWIVAVVLALIGLATLKLR